MSAWGDIQRRQREEAEACLRDRLREEYEAREAERNRKFWEDAAKLHGEENIHGN